jgi:hypothetical protein
MERDIGTQQLVNVEITENVAIFAEDGWKDVELVYWACQITKKYVKMCQINKLFFCAI